MNAQPSNDKFYITKKDAHYAQDIDFVGAKTSDEFTELVNREMAKFLGNRR